MYHFTPMIKCTAVAFGLPHACSRRPLVSAAGFKTCAPRTLLHVGDQADRLWCHWDAADSCSCQTVQLRSLRTLLKPSQNQMLRMKEPPSYVDLLTFSCILIQNCNTFLSRQASLVQQDVYRERCGQASSIIAAEWPRRGWHAVTHHDDLSPPPRPAREEVLSALWLVFGGLYASCLSM